MEVASEKLEGKELRRNLKQWNNKLLFVYFTKNIQILYICKILLISWDVFKSCESAKSS